MVKSCASLQKPHRSVGRLERIFHTVTGRLRICMLATGKTINSGVTMLRPSVYRDVRLGQKSDCCYALRFKSVADKA